MDAKTFLEKYGVELCTRVAEKAGTTYPYFSQIAHGHRRPSTDLAHRLVAACHELITEPDCQLDLLSLLRPKPHKPVSPVHA